MRKGRARVMQRVTLSCDTDSTEVSVGLQGAPEQGAPGWGQGLLTHDTCFPVKLSSARIFPERALCPSNWGTQFFSPEGGHGLACHGVY